MKSYHTDTRIECEICRAGVEGKVFKHHLVPRSKGGTKGEIVLCCEMCNSQVHMLFSNSELANMSIGELLQTPEMVTYLKWKQSHNGKYKHRLSKRLRKRRRH